MGLYWKWAWINICRGVGILSGCCRFENACVIEELISCHFCSACDELSQRNLFGMSSHACWVESGQPSLFWLSGVSGLGGEVFPRGSALFLHYTLCFCHVKRGCVRYWWVPTGGPISVKVPWDTVNVFVLRKQSLWEWRDSPWCYMIWDQPL